MLIFKELEPPQVGSCAGEFYVQKDAFGSCAGGVGLCGAVSRCQGRVEDAAGSRAGGGRAVGTSRAAGCRHAAGPRHRLAFRNQRR